MKKVILASTLGFAVLAGANVAGIETAKVSAASLETNTATMQGNQLLHEGEYHPSIEAYEYEIGHVVEVYTDITSGVTSVLFEYTSLNGETLEMEVQLREGQTFHVGDKVRVHTGHAFWGISLGGFVVLGEIEKVND
ncbi:MULTISPECIES: hypothetical protein [unclassified Bacillus cereus group]|uniref:hypothetical protein n=1 Tax=unclassified Bacillus cereus group TaxID=2750818 RepID=UPI001F59B33B|nr:MULTISPECIES: hypothetical protein [unclassified Bacillus cereus group]